MYDIVSGETDYRKLCRICIKGIDGFCELWNIETYDFDIHFRLCLIETAYVINKNRRNYENLKNF